MEIPITLALHLGHISVGPYLGTITYGLSCLEGGETVPEGSPCFESHAYLDLRTGSGVCVFPPRWERLGHRRCPCWTEVEEPCRKDERET